jgi:hypothetical protein
MSYTTSGTYSNIYASSLGCDSTHTLNLTVNYSPNTTNILGVINVNSLQIETYSVSQNLNSIFSFPLVLFICELLNNCKSLYLKAV